MTIAKKGLPNIKRKSASFSQEDLVKTGLLPDGGNLPLVVTPAVEGVDLVAWVGNNRDLIQQALYKHGGVLFRGFNLSEIGSFEQFTKAASQELLEYKERSSPRSQVSGNIYTSTDYPSHQHIFFHNENSYQHAWPMKLFFYCVIPAQQGGETPIVDVRKVYQRIDPSIRAEFAAKNVMYVRNFSQELGLPWETVFQTTDKAQVEAYCADHGIQAEWRDGNRLRTRVIRPALAKHPVTGEDLWFNHGAFFHVSTLEASIRDALLSQFAEEDLPSNTYYGDGSTIAPEYLQAIRDAYHAEARIFPWEQHDVIILDNMLTAHARTPYSGPRKILVGMSEPLSRSAL